MTDAVWEWKAATWVHRFGDLHLVDVGAGGHCQFRALASVLLGTSSQYPLLRRVIADQLRKGLDGYELAREDVPATSPQYATTEEFANAIESTNEWGNTGTLQACADALRIEIFVLSSLSGGSLMKIFPRDELLPARCRIHVAHYSEYHFVVVRPNPSSPELRLLRQPGAPAGSLVKGKKYLYVLKLEDDCWYVGIADDVERRVGQHRDGSGSEWTRLHKVVRLEHFWEDKGGSGFSEFQENAETFVQMELHGIDRVRGGRYCQVVLPPERVREILDNLSAARGYCYCCRGEGHRARDCPVRQRAPPLHDLLPARVEWFRDFLGREAQPVEREALPAVNPLLTVDVNSAPEAVLERIGDQLVTSGMLDGAVFVEIRTRPGQDGNVSPVRIAHPDTLQLTEQGQSLSPPAREFIRVALPGVARGTQCLHPHQWTLMNPATLPLSNAPEDVLLTAGTGQGKTASALFRLFHHLWGDDDSTSLVLVPTQALLSQHAASLARIGVATGGDVEWGDLEDGHRIPMGGSISWPRGDGSGERRKMKWTVWCAEGASLSETKEGTARLMEDHVQTPSFRTARIVLCTPDKAHFSLLSDSGSRDPSRQNWCRRIVSHLRFVFIDEVHLCEGVFGANIHYLLARLRSLADGPGFGVFLASATVSNARVFAERLLGRSADDGRPPLRHLEDGFVRDIRQLDGLEDVKEVLAKHESKNGRLSVAVFVPEYISVDHAADLMGTNVLGGRLRSILFSSSKFISQTLNRQLRSKYRNGEGQWKRRSFVYDADRATIDRREIESTLDRNEPDGTTVVGTSALGVGVDFPGVRVVTIMKMPEDRSSLLQWMGRTGRTAEIPGIVVVGVDSESPHGRLALEDPCSFLEADHGGLQLPLNLESLILRQVRCWMENWAVMGRNVGQWQLVKDGILAHLATHGGNACREALVSQLVAVDERWRESAERAMTALDQVAEANQLKENEKQWYRLAFRSLSLRKVPLVWCGVGENGKLYVKKRGSDPWVIALIDPMQLFSVAHPDGLYWSDGPWGGHGTFEIAQYVMRRLHQSGEDPILHYPVGQWCAQCELMLGQRSPANECRYRRLHVHEEGAETCDECWPMLGAGGTMVPRPVGGCPVGVWGRTPGKWLKDLQMVLAVKVDTEHAPFRTRGFYQDSVDPPAVDVAERPLPQAVARLQGQLVHHGLWIRKRKWMGYDLYRRRQRQSRMWSGTVWDRWDEGRRSNPAVGGSDHEAWDQLERPFMKAAHVSCLGIEWAPHPQPTTEEREEHCLDNQPAQILTCHVMRVHMSQIAGCSLSDIEVQIQSGDAWSLRLFESGTNSGAVDAVLSGGGPFADGAGWEEDVLTGFDDEGDLLRRVLEQCSRDEAVALAVALEGGLVRERSRKQLEWMREKWE